MFLQKVVSRFLFLQYGWSRALPRTAPYMMWHNIVSASPTGNILSLDFELKLNISAHV